MTLVWRLLLALLLIVEAAGAEPGEALSVYGAQSRAPATMRARGPVAANTGPHLLIDDELIESSRNLARVVVNPTRDGAIANALIRGEEDRCFQPYFTVLRDPATRRFRLWYGAWTEAKETNRSRLAYLESEDGVRWQRPARILDQPAEIQFGSEVIDRGAVFKDPTSRYAYSYYLDRGLRIAVSPDGLAFRPLVDRVVLPHDHDINNIAWDELRRRYVATVSTMATSQRFSGKRRTTMQSFSDDLIHWSPPAIVLSADDAVDQGDTQFYAMNGFLTRGPLLIGMVKVLRDDLFCDPDETLRRRNGGYGTGYTALAWTRDGTHWVRDREVFLDRGPTGSWDRSHAWIDEQLIVDERVYLYYAGYRSGHKANRFADRQIGLVTMPLDRYVARQPADPTRAYLITVALQLAENSRRLELNADASRGAIRVQLRDGDTNAVLAGFGFDDCDALSADGLRLAVRWRGLGGGAFPRGKQIRVEFELERAKLFAFDFPSP